ncbi:MAG: sigma 54-interacting transcriptional regulator [Armatimonadetes bacterium]|nr:sigma 54-interacting transcriptional regulator [Armatimonadota bacterium]
MQVKDALIPIENSLTPDQTIFEAWQLFKQAKVPALPVRKEDGQVAGLVYKDTLFNLGPEALKTSLRVREIIDEDFPCLKEDAPLIDVCSLPQDIFLVVDGQERVSGILSKEAAWHVLLDSAILMVEQLITLLDSVHNGIIAVNTEGIITLFNKEAEKITGRSKNAAIGKPLAEVINAPELLQVLKDGRPKGVQRLSVDYAAGKRIYLVNQSPVVENNQIVGAVGVFQDITEIESTSQELGLVKEINKELECIIESSSDGILITDPAGNIIKANQAHERITGLASPNIEGKNMQELIKAGIYTTPVVEAVLKEKKSVTVVESKSDQHQLLVTGNPVFNQNGEITRIVINVRDLTEMNKLVYQLEQARRLSERYYDELTQLRAGSLKQEGIIFSSPKMQELLALALRLAQVDSTVLILGESGVGKEVIAKLMHRYSKRKKGPFITVNCSAIPENLLESELFGYERGAFTGANREGKIGLFELADNGTLFLDEISEIPLPFQAKLLRAIQEKEIMPVGGSKPRPVNIRILAATNRDLEALVREGKFREDLYFRLNVVPLSLWPLRERRQDIIPLAYNFRDKFCKAYGLKKDFAPEVLGVFLEYNWPGNVRELENLVERLVVTSPGDRITLADLPRNLFEHLDHSPNIQVRGVLPLRQAVLELERQLIQNALREYGSTYKAAKALNIDQSTLVRKVRRIKTNHL